MIMYDSINADAIPADATDLLGYTDGIHANIAALRARFPNARIHTISAVGAVVGEWIDVEPGCVWPNQTAASLYGVWVKEGCKGYYSYLSNMQALKEAHQGANPGVPAEYFDANATSVVHVDPGYVATQFEQVAGYDESDTTPTFEGTTATTDSPSKDTTMLIAPGRFDLIVSGAGNQLYWCTAPSWAALITATWVPIPGAVGTDPRASWDETNANIFLTWQTLDNKLGMAAYNAANNAWGGVAEQAHAALAPPPVGPAGPQGPQGLPGPMGAPGAAGLTLPATVTITAG